MFCFMWYHHNMEAFPGHKALQSEDFLPLLEIKLAGMTKADIAEPGTYRLSVGPNYKVYIAGQHLRHADLDKKYGVPLAETYTEGYVRVGDDGKIAEIEFKPPAYQQYQRAPEYRTQTAELKALQGAVESAIRGYFAG